MKERNSMEVKDKIVDLLKDTGRTGMINLIDYMEEGGFFTAPCSSKYHLCREGGLAEHSLNVYYGMLEIDKALNAGLPNDSIIICGILHDLGKMGDYGKANYIENILKSGKVSTAEPYKTNPELSYITHEIKSISIAQRYILLTEDEEFSILYHNGMYSPLSRQYQGKETPMSLILHWADMWASRITEVEKEEEE